MVHFVSPLHIGAHSYRCSPFFIKSHVRLTCSAAAAESRLRPSRRFAAAPSFCGPRAFNSASQNRENVFFTAVCHVAASCNRLRRTLPLRLPLAVRFPLPSQPAMHGLLPADVPHEGSARPAETPQSACVSSGVPIPALPTNSRDADGCRVVG